MFEKATRACYRYPSIKGQVTTEDLWSLPLTGPMSLDSTARLIARQIRETGEESFIPEKADPATKVLKDKLEVVKHIIGVRVDEQKARVKAAERARAKQQLLEILHSKKTDELKGLSVEELEKKIDELQSV